MVRRKTGQEFGSGIEFGSEWRFAPKTIHPDSSVKRFAQIVYAIIPAGGAIYGMAAHNSYSMGFAICGIIGGALGYIAGTLLILVTALVLNGLSSGRLYPSKKQFR